jgi:hypothetical protein
MASFTLHIQYVDRPAETRVFTNRDQVTFGRDVGDIALRDSQVSGRHGQITFTGGVLRYEDFGSTNGSFLLDGRRIHTLELSQGMTIRLGNSLIAVQALDSPLAAGKGRTMVAGAGLAPFAPPPGPPPSRPLVGAPTPAASPAADDPQALGLAPTGYMPAISAPPGFQQPVARPPEAPPPAPPRPEIDDEEATVQHLPVVDSAPAPGALPISGGDLTGLLKQAWSILQPVIIPASLITGAITVPIALIGGILGFIPYVGAVVGFIFTLAQIALMPLAVAAVYRFMLGRYLGAPIDPQTAWRQQIDEAREVWPSFFLASLIAGVGALFLIIPGILLGIFIGPVYFVEGKRMVDINLRTLELTKRDPLPLIILVFIVAIALAIALAIPLAIFGLLGAVGGLLSAVLLAALGAVILPFGATLALLLYFGLRRRFEGGEPEEAARAILTAVEAAKPLSQA